MLMHHLTKEDSFVPGLLLKQYLQIDQDKIEIDDALDIQPDEVPIHPRKKR